MIGKWRNKIIIYGLITVFLAVIGFYLYKNTMDTNRRMERLKESTPVKVDMLKLESINYVGNESFRWGYNLPDSNNVEGKFDGVTITTYSLEDYQKMEGRIEVCYYYDGDTLITFDKDYVYNFKPWVPTQSIILWVIAGVTFLVALYYLGRNIFIWYILAKGEESIGSFIEAVHPKTGSIKYYKIKYTFSRNGETVTVDSPAYYVGREVDKIRSYGQFIVKYIGKYSVIDLKV